MGHFQRLSITHAMYLQNETFAREMSNLEQQNHNMVAQRGPKMAAAAISSCVGRKRGSIGYFKVIFD